MSRSDRCRRARSRQPAAIEQTLRTARGGSVEHGELAPVMAPDSFGPAARAVARARPEDLRGAALRPRSAAALAGAASAVAAHAAVVGHAARGCAEHRPLRGAAPRGALSLRAAGRHDGGARPIPAPPALSSRPCGAQATSASAGATTGCRTITALAAPSSGLPGRLKGETQLLMGYCAAGPAMRTGAGLAAEPGARGRRRGRAAAGGAGGRCRRQQAAGCACPSACCCSTTASWSCSAPSTRAQIFDKAEPALLAALAGDRPGRRAPARSPLPRPRCVSTR